MFELAQCDFQPYYTPTSASMFGRNWIVLVLNRSQRSVYFYLFLRKKKVEVARWHKLFLILSDVSVRLSVLMAALHKHISKKESRMTLEKTILESDWTLGRLRRSDDTKMKIMLSHSFSKGQQPSLLIN